MKTAGPEQQPLSFPSKGAQRRRAIHETESAIPLRMREYELRVRSGLFPEMLAALEQWLIAQASVAPQTCADAAWDLLQTPGVPARARRTALALARQANTAAGGKVADILDTLAYAEYRNGNARAAFALQCRVVRIEPQCRPYVARFNRYESKAA